MQDCFLLDFSNLQNISSHYPHFSDKSEQILICWEDNILKTISTALPIGGKIRYFLFLFFTGKENSRYPTSAFPSREKKSLHCSNWHKYEKFICLELRTEMCLFQKTENCYWLERAKKLKPEKELLNQKTTFPTL